jgi:leader peptidase (prepilin peptidase)/N-methyltransferase
MLFKIQPPISIIYNTVLTNKWIELAILVIFLIPLVIKDIKEKRIPNLYTLTGIGVFLTKRILEKQLPLYIIAINVSSGFMFFLLLYFSSKGKIGMGDAKLSALLSLALGLKGWIFAILTASFTGLLFGILMIKMGKMEKNDPIPFAPFLSLGGISGFFLKDIILFPW